MIYYLAKTDPKKRTFPWSIQSKMGSFASLYKDFVFFSFRSFRKHRRARKGERESEREAREWAWRARVSVKGENERGERERKITSPLPARGANQKVGFASSYPLSLLVLSFAPWGFSPGSPVFSPPQKPTVPNSNSTRNQVDKEPLS